MNGYISRKQNGTTGYLFKNVHGDVVVVAGQSGNILVDYAYDAWGGAKATDAWGRATATQWGTSNPIRYNGQYYDTESGMTYLRARYYNSGIRRFITEDPIRDGLNWYAYAGNNPVMFVDPSGLYGEEWLTVPWVRQEAIWKNGVNALRAGGLSMSAELLNNAIKRFYNTDVYILDEWAGVEVEGSNTINGDYIVYGLRNDHTINNEIDYRKSCAEKAGQKSFYWSDVLTLDSTTDSYLSFYHCTVTLNGQQNDDGSWVTRVTVFDRYDFDREKLQDINNLKQFIGSAAATIAWMEQIPILGALKPYNITVEYLTAR